MEEVQEFIKEFHNLEGVSIAEKKRNLFRLFRKNSSFSNNQSLLNSLTSHLTAQTHLERLFLVEFLIYYGRFDELYTEFMKGDDIVISKIAKEQWFFRKAFRNIGPEFVTQVLPTLSYSLRLKVLKKLVHILPNEQCDAIFDALHHHYGIFMATNILTSCSRDKIEEILKNYPIKLWTSQLKLMYKQDPNLLYVYFEERVRHEGNTKFLNFDPIFAFIAMKNPEMYCNLQEKYKFPSCHIGKRTTKKVIKTNKDKIIAKAVQYATNLNSAQFVRTLAPDFHRAYFKFFPKQPERVFSSMKFLRYYPKKSQFDLFHSTFNQIFHQKLEVSYNLINPILLKIIIESDERENWARRKLEHEESDVYLQYFKAQDCVDAIKRKLDVASDVAKRIEGVSIMTESCLINRDWGVLLQVCQLLCAEFKNDHKRVHAMFLTVLLSNCSVFDHLDGNHWKYIREIIIIKRVKIDTSLLCFKYFEFLYNQNESLLEEEIAILGKDCNWIDHLYSLHTSNPKSERTILTILIKLAPQLIKSDDKIEQVDCKLLSACEKYNFRKPKDMINIFEYPRLLQSVKSALTVKKNPFDFCYTQSATELVTEWIICSKNRNETVEDLTELFWNNSKHVTPSCFKWFLQHQPELVVKHIDKFLLAMISGKFDYLELKEMRKICRTIKCYTHLAFDRKLIELCVEKLNDDSFEEKTRLVQPLSLVMTAQDFVNLIELYKPTSSTVDLLDADKNELFQLQRHMLKSFVNVQEPRLIISLILQFCSGDYVASCLSALYSCLYKIPQDCIEQLLSKLRNTPALSVKKHGYFFKCVIFEDVAILQCLQSCRLSQVIAMSYQHFVKNPSDQSWLLFKDKLSKLDKNDHFTNLLLVNIPAPKKYKSVFFQTTLETFRNQNNKFTNVLLDKVDKDTVAELQTQFFTKITDQFLTMHKSNVIFSYLICCKDCEKFSVVFDALRTFKLKNWSFRGREAREKLDKFVKVLFDTYMDWEGRDDRLIDAFIEGFQEIFKPVEAFEEFITISLMRFKHFNIDDLSRAVADLNNKLVGNYGKLIISNLADCLGNLLMKLYEDEAKIYEFCHDLLSFDGNIDNLLLVIQLLPKTKPQLEECVEYYYKIFDLLKKIDDEVVQVHLNLVFSEENRYLN